MNLVYKCYMYLMYMFQYFLSLMGKKRVITLWVDINNTIFFFDPASGKTFTVMLNNILVESVKGFSKGTGPLDWIEHENGDTTYWNHLMSLFGKKEAQKYRETAFHADHPLQGRFEELSSKLIRILEVPDECLKTYEGIKIDDPDGRNVHPILPSFLRTIISLQSSGYQIKVNFTTFGMDVHVLQTWLAFKQGRLNGIVQSEARPGWNKSVKIKKENPMNVAHFRWEERDGKMVPYLRLWKDIDVATAVRKYDSLSHEPNPDFKDILQTTCNQYVEGIPEIFLALAEVKGDTFINNDHPSWAGSGKLPEMGKIIPYMENHLAFDDNSDSCMAAYNPETGEPVTDRSMIFVADPLNVFDEYFFEDAIRGFLPSAPSVTHWLAAAAVTAVVAIATRVFMF